MPPDLLGRDPAAAPPPIKQRRSQRTYDALLSAGLRLLRDRDLDAIPVVEIARAAGYSVGAFYARFNNKEEFHRALVDRYAADRIASFDALFAATDDERLLDAYFEHQIANLWAHRHLWRASLRRSFQDPQFWEPYRAILAHVGEGLAARAARRIGRALTAEEVLNIRFAAQLTTSTINVTIMNRPGPVHLEDPGFHARVVRAFRLVSGWETLA